MSYWETTPKGIAAHSILYFPSPELPSHSTSDYTLKRENALKS